MDEGLGLDLSTSSITVSLWDGLIILLGSALAGFIIRYFFYKFGDSMSSRRAFGNTILITTVSVASLIAVVKSSLALSLGLVGALSVVRFRTAVKEPYNLSFLLLSICIGIAIGASQFIFAILTCILGCILTFVLSNYSQKFNKLSKSDDVDSISITIPEGTDIDNVYAILNKYTNSYNIKTLSENSDGFINITLRASITNINDLEKLRKNLKTNFLGIEFAFYESPGK